MRIRTESRGFTIIELLFVVVIIGIIVAMVIPNYIKFTKKAKEAVVQENMHTMQLAIEAYSVDRLDTYPQAADEVNLLPLMPQGRYLDNPFTNDETTVLWNADPVEAGNISIFTLPEGGYMLRARGANQYLDDIVVGE